MSEEEILYLFPGQVKAFALGELQKSVAPVAPMLLDKHFYEPPSKESVTLKFAIYAAYSDALDVKGVNDFLHSLYCRWFVRIGIYSHQTRLYS